MRRAVPVAVALLLAGCAGADDGATDATESMVLETCAPGTVPVEVQVCTCAYEELNRRLDAAELARLDRQLRDDPETVPAEVQAVVLECGFEVLAPPTTTKPSTTTTTSRSRPGGSTTTTFPP
jgi:hypothetical protein